MKPFRLTTAATLEEIQSAASAHLYPTSPIKPSSGWGSVDDDESGLGLPAAVGASPREAAIEDGFKSDPKRRLRLRYYWAQLDNRLVRSRGDSAPWGAIHTLEAMDFILYEESPHTFTCLVTARPTPLFKNRAVPAILDLVLTVDDTPQLVSDNLTESLDEDFFLWLVDRDENVSDIGDGLMLGSIVEISSKDRLFRSARFKDTANAERIELAALIAKGKAGFGPAKVRVSSEPLEAFFEIEFHLDGGFQVLRSSEYDDAQFSSEELGKRLVDDVWTVVLPQFRRAYTADDDWGATRRRGLREAAVDTICDQLDLVRKP